MSPELRVQLGKGLRQLRDATDDIKRDIRSSVEDIEKDVKRNMDDVNIKKDITEAQAAIQKNIDDIVRRPSRLVKDNIQEFKDTVEKSALKETKVGDESKEVKEPKVVKEQKVRKGAVKKESDSLPKSKQLLQLQKL